MLHSRLGKELLIFDGAMGTQLQNAGLKGGDVPEYLNIEKPELLLSIHKAYLEAGADFISLNTFGANPLKMNQDRYSTKQVVEAAVRIGKQAQASAEKETYLVIDLGPIGRLMEPMGTLTFDEVYQSVQEIVSYAKDDVDAVLFETMTDLYEVKASVLAVKETCNLPVFVTMTYEANGRTLAGADPISTVSVLEALHVDALGVNCSLGPSELSPIVDAFVKYSHVPLMMQPNAGLPQLIDGQTVYDMTPQAFAKESVKQIEKGISIAGGCCGTTPDFIKELVLLADFDIKKRNVEETTIVSSGMESVLFGEHTVVCGERLNPTGKKKLKAAIKEARYDTLVLEGIKQEKAGAHVLDVNVGLPGIDEPEVMQHVIRLLQEVISLPLQIDSSHPEAIEKGCRYYNGKPLINSVNGKQEVMQAIFPIVKKYGGVVIGLTIDEAGIPEHAQERYEIAKKIIACAASYGIPKRDIIIDCLVLTASAQQAEVMETIKAVSMVKTLGVHTVLGVSNVSFGLPNRPLLNKTFLAMALSAGLDMPIMNPMDEEMMHTIEAFDVLANHDHEAVNYIEKQSGEKAYTPSQSQDFSLSELVLHGVKDEVLATTRSLLEKQDGLTIINDILIPALNTVGKQYEQNKIFLPQLIQSAEAAKIAFELIQSSFSESKNQKGTFVLATVEGDVHDIGKNIVKVVAQSYGYEVIDLGKDVKIEKVIEAYERYQPDAIGLSALMTTTVTSMKKTIEALKEKGSHTPIIVGGAVVTQDVADQVGANYYASDAMTTVEILNQIVHV